MYRRLCGRGGFILEFSYNDVKQMDVVSVKDGRHLGKVCDIVFSFPEGRVCGFYVTGCKGFRFTKPDTYLPFSSIVRIGEDVIIIDAELAPSGDKGNCRKPKKCCPPREESCRQAPKDRRSYDEYE